MEKKEDEKEEELRRHRHCNHHRHRCVFQSTTGAPTGYSTTRQHQYEY